MKFHDGNYFYLQRDIVFLQGGKVKNNAFNIFKVLNEANKSFIHFFL